MNPSKEGKDKGSVLKDKEKIGKKEAADKLAHMGDKPGGERKADKKPSKRKE